jgi:hypothetical protein
MEARSPYKLRDDLKVLWKGAMTTGTLGQLLAREPKLSESLNRVDVGLPSESSKGSFSVGPRQIDSIFKPVALDKKVMPVVRRTQADLVQAYYRYLYTYNKFALAQQTYAARKQEVEVAGSDSEKQRAAADLSQAQNEAESSREDMKAAQMELSAAAGPNAARSIIGRVSGIAPTSEALTAQEPQAAPVENKGIFGFGLGGLFGSPKKEVRNPEPMLAAAAPMLEPAKPARAAKEPKSAKVDNKTKGAKDSKNSKDKSSIAGAAVDKDKNDLQAAPASSRDSGQAGQAAQVEVSQNGVSLELKGVNVTARKSILTVSIRNSGQSDFSFNPESFTVSENNHKLSEAAMRADFETTLVQPSQEVKGTITIFGRPWNDRLTVSLSDGTRNLQMRR